MNILVTGGAGFIGSHLCEHLLQVGHRVIAMDNFDDFYSKSIKKDNVKEFRDYPKFNLVSADVIDTDNLIDILISKRIHLIVHAAGRSGALASSKNPSEFIRINELGTLSVLEAMKESDTKKLVFLSSSSAYGVRETITKRESDPLGVANSVYAATKQNCENLIRMYHRNYDIQSVVLRLFSIYGERQKPDSGMYKFVSAALKLTPLTLYDEGNIVRDYTYVSDAVEGITSACMYLYQLPDQTEPEIFNIAQSKSVYVKEILKIIEELTGNKIQTLPKRPPENNNFNQGADIDKAAKVLGYSPKVTLKVGLERMVAWLQTQIVQ